ncbi:hypothetical protein [Synechococcus sp. KORDI-100]|uniref:hypothetical protein n=1 Tax=Synechococcus sp. KORDI-100 TaxID=1280380 RepID=UPI00350F8470
MTGQSGWPMLTTATRLRIQDILRRVAQGQSVSLQDRIYVNKFAEHDRTVNSWVNRARRMQLQQAPSKGLDGFLDDLDLGSEEEGDQYRGDLGDWFGNASPWLRRD